MNKKVIIAVICIIGIVAAGAVVAVSKGLLSHNEAKGIILYGTEEQLSADLSMEKENTEYSYQTKVKLVNDDMIVIREKDMKEFVKIQIVNSVNSQEECEPVSGIDSATEKPVLYAKNAATDITVNGAALEVTAGDDLILGNGRTFKEGYLMVSDSKYEEIQGTETGMLVLQLNKAADKEIMNCQFEEVQLIEIP